MARTSNHAWLLAAALAAMTSPVSAEDLLQSIPLDSSDVGFVDAATFVRNGDFLYLAGGFYGQVDFNPNGAPSIWFSTCPTTYGCSFVVAYDANMQIAWLDIIYGTGSVADHLLVPKTGGGVYLLLDFTDDLAYLPNTTQPVFHAAGESDVAVIALDDHGESAGSAQFGSTGTSVLRNARPFESGPDTVDVAWVNRAASGSAVNAIVSRASIDTGTIAPPLLEIEGIDTSSYANIYDQRPDADGRYACGIFHGNVDFDALHAHRFATTQSVDAFVARYDTAGALVWLSTMTAETGASCDGLALDTDGNLWATGGFGGAAYVQYDGNPVPVEVTSWGFDDTYLLTYDALGSLRTSAHLGGFQTQVFPSRIEAAADGSVTIVGGFIGTITNGFAGTLMRSSDSDYIDAFLRVVNRDLTTRYFGQLTYADGYTLENSLQLSGPMQIETIAQMSMPTGGNAYLDYALPPEHALLHNDGTFASAYARYDLDTVLADGFDSATP